MKKPRKKLRRILLIIGIVFLVCYLLIWWLGRAPRNPNENVTLSVHAGSFKHTENKTSGLSRNSNGNIKAVRCRTVHVYSPSNSPLMIMVGKAVAERLQALPWSESVTLFHAGEGPEPGNLAPDLTFSLDVADLHESGILSSKLRGTFNLMGGNSPIKKIHHYDDFWTPVGIKLSITVNANLRCRFVGIATESGFYGQVANAVAKSLAQSIDSYIAKELKEGQPFPELPDNFYPTYQKPIELPECLTKFSPKMILSDHGLTESCRTFWMFQSDMSYKEIFALIDEAMKGTGWSVSTDGACCSGCHFRIKNGEDILEFFQGFHPENPLGAVKIAWHDKNAKPDSKKPPTPIYYIEYRNRMSRTKIEKAIDTILIPETPVETLLFFKSKVNDRQRKRLIELLEKSNTSIPDAMLQLAEFYQVNDKTKEKAKDALYRAWVLSKVKGCDSKMGDKIKEIAKKLELGSDYPNKRYLETDDVAVLEELGFWRLPFDRPGKKLPISPGKSVRFVALDKDNQVFTLTLEMGKNDSERGYGLNYCETHRNSRSWGGSYQHNTYNLNSPLFYRFQLKKSDQADNAEKFYLDVTTP